MIDPQRVGWAALFVSSLVHAWLFSVAPPKTKSPVKTMSSMVEFRVVEMPPPPPPVEPEPEPEPEPEVEEPRPAPQPEPPPIPEPEAAEPPPSEEAPAENEEPPPAELTGTTLAADEGAAWSAPAGSGRERSGPLRAGVSRPVREGGGRKVVAKRAAAPPPPALPGALPLSELSRPPRPPSLGGALQRNYPAEARQQGRGGEAKVRARIEPSGRVQLAKVVGETSSGFGAACKKTVLGSQWSAPLDKNGKPVATWVSYRCKFRVDQ